MTDFWKVINIKINTWHERDKDIRGMTLSSNLNTELKPRLAECWKGSRSLGLGYSQLNREEQEASCSRKKICQLYDVGQLSRSTDYIKVLPFVLL